MLTAGDYRTKFIYLYGFIYSGLAALALLILNQYAYYDYFSDEVAFILGLAGFFVLLINGKIKISALTLFILSYILVRVMILSTFATIHSYSVLNYLFPLKNWVVLLLFFVIGQSLNLPRERVNDILLKIFIATSILVILFQMYCLMFGRNFTAFDASRLPLVKYRVGLDIFLMIYVFIISTLRYLQKNISSKYYYFIIVLVIADFISSQTKQIAISVFLVLLYLLFDKAVSHTKRKRVLMVSFIILLVTLGMFAMLVLQNPFGDSYFSFLKRVELIEYAQGKISQYPVAGYPIPSNIAHGVIPTEIKNTFFSGDRADLIYPSDLPLLSVVLEEGILGLIFIFVLLYWSYKKNTDVKYVVLLICTTFLTFRMYYMVTLGSTLTYFLLGFYTRDSLSGQKL